MNKVETILAKMERAREQLNQLEQDFLDARREVSEAVVFSRAGNTITLTHGKKQYKVTKNGRGRWCVKLEGKVVVGDYTSGMNELRYDIATGRLFQLGNCRI